MPLTQKRAAEAYHIVLLLTIFIQIKQTVNPNDLTFGAILNQPSTTKKPTVTSKPTVPSGSSAIHPRCGTLPLYLPSNNLQIKVIRRKKASELQTTLWSHATAASAIFSVQLECAPAFQKSYATLKNENSRQRKSRLAFKMLL